jgi:hypothetical protein
MVSASAVRSHVAVVQADLADICAQRVEFILDGD